VAFRVTSTVITITPNLVKISHVVQSRNEYRQTVTHSWISPMKDLKCKGNTICIQACTCPDSSRRLMLPGFIDNKHMKVLRLSALHTSHFNAPKRYTWYSFLLEAQSTLGP